MATVNKGSAGNLKSGLSFEWILFLIVLVVVNVGAYESITQSYMPEYSLQNISKNFGFLQGYITEYGPGKGIWRLFGWIGSFMMIFLMLYTVRKRVKVFKSIGRLRSWLSFHMFLGILGPVFITLHTTFKLGGIIATSFWCMVVTMVFGILGRYIYIQIPRTIKGAEMKAEQITDIVKAVDKRLGKYMSRANMTRLFNELNIKDEVKNNRCPIHALYYMLRADIVNRVRVYRILKILKDRYSLSKTNREQVLVLLQRKQALIRRKNLLKTSHALLHYWHVLHIPLAIVMFILMFLHILVYYLFRPGLVA